MGNHLTHSTVGGGYHQMTWIKPILHLQQDFDNETNRVRTRATDEISRQVIYEQPFSKKKAEELRIP